MTTLDRLHAVATRPLTRIPDRLDAAAIADTLERLEPALALPVAVKALAASGAKLGSSGHQVSLTALDAALKTANLPVDQRIKFKMALSAQGVLASSDRRISNQGRI
jgi:hypothetical protein